MTHQQNTERIFEILCFAKSYCKEIDPAFLYEDQLGEIIEAIGKDLVALKCAINPEDEIQGMSQYDL